MESGTAQRRLIGAAGPAGGQLSGGGGASEDRRAARARAPGLMSDQVTARLASRVLGLLVISASAAGASCGSMQGNLPVAMSPSGCRPSLLRRHRWRPTTTGVCFEMACFAASLPCRLSGMGSIDDCAASHLPDHVVALSPTVRRDAFSIRPLRPQHPSTRSGLPRRLSALPPANSAAGKKAKSIFTATEQCCANSHSKDGVAAGSGWKRARESEHSHQPHHGSAPSPRACIPDYYYL